MLKRVFNYVDFYGVARIEEAFFYLNESELMELALTPEGGFDTMIKRIIESHDSKTIIQTFREIIMKAYGKKSDDGRRFIKGADLSEDFSQTPMFNQLLMEIVTDSNKAAEFCSKIIPSSDSPVATNARKAMAKVDMKKKMAAALPADFYAPISAPGYREETMGEIPTTVEEVIGDNKVEGEPPAEQEMITVELSQPGSISADQLSTRQVPTANPAMTATPPPPTVVPEQTIHFVPDPLGPTPQPM